MSKTNPIKSTSVPSAYDTPLTTLEYLRKVQEQNAQVLARAQEIENSLEGLHTEIAGVGNSKVSKSGDTMTGALNVPQVNANTGVFRTFNAVSQDEHTHVEVSNGGFIAEVTEETTGNKKYGVIAYPNGKVGFYAHDSAHNKDVGFIIPNMDDYEAGTYELATKNDIPSGGSSLLEDIEDEDGHKRFAVYNGTTTLTSAQIDNSYIKATLNGYLLHIVCFIHKLDGITLSANTILCEFAIPSWLADKIIASNGGYLCRTSYSQFDDSNNPSSAGGNVFLRKVNNALQVIMVSGDTQGALPNIRIDVSLTIE